MDKYDSLLKQLQETKDNFKKQIEAVRCVEIGHAVFQAEGDKTMAPVQFSKCTFTKSPVKISDGFEGV
jgi:alpha-D-ribose 1-methylphosphonate 5-triphosphate synthase subunit PhnG